MKRLQLNGSVPALEQWGRVTPAVEISASYEPGDRAAALDLLQALLDAARAESAPEHGGAA